MNNCNKNNKLLKGKVIKINTKTITVLIYKIKKHKLYKKFLKFNKKINVHDEKNIANLGNKVLIKYYKPISKNKSWILEKIIN